MRLVVVLDVPEAEKHNTLVTLKTLFKSVTLCEAAATFDEAFESELVSAMFESSTESKQVIEDETLDSLE